MDRRDVVIVDAEIAAELPPGHSARVISAAARGARQPIDTTTLFDPDAIE